MDFVDYYKILGIEKTTTEKDIKNAYIKLARKYHPDLNPNDKDEKSHFQQINEANEVLSDPQKCKKYNQYEKDWQHANEFEKAKQYQQQHSGSRSTGFSGGQSEGNFSDFFESMFGGGGFGDLYVPYYIKIPTNLTDKQCELFTELSKSQKSVL